jgi:hypothetical protein
MNKIVSKLNSIKSLLNENKIATEGAKYMQSITPIKGGNARRNTIVNGNLIEANYPYAKRLDEGWSKQNQIGLIDPTMKHMEEYIKKGAN